MQADVPVPDVVTLGQPVEPAASSPRGPHSAEEEAIIGRATNEPGCITEGLFHPNGYSFCVSDNGGRVTLLTCASLAPFANTPFEQYLSDDYNQMVMDGGLNVADAVNQLPPHVRYAQQTLLNLDGLPYPVQPVRRGEEARLCVLVMWVLLVSYVCVCVCACMLCS